MWRPTSEGENVTDTQASYCDSTYSLVGAEGEESMSRHHHSDRERDQETRRSIENGGTLNSKAAATASVDGERENMHQVQEDDDDEDHVYFVLEGPTPNSVKGGSRKRQEVNEQRQEVEGGAGIRGQEVDDAVAKRQEVEATPYEIPLALYTKKEKQDLATKYADKS